MKRREIMTLVGGASMWPPGAGAQKREDLSLLSVC